MMKKSTLWISLFMLFGLFSTKSPIYAQALSGNYTIGSSGNYSTVIAAVTALKANGVSGPVKFTISNGTYTGRVVIPEITGASSTNTITFDGVDSSTSIIKFTGTSTANRATVVLDGADYITFKNVTIENDGGSGSNANALGVFLTDDARYDSFLNCIIKVPTMSNSYQVMVISASGQEQGMYNGDNANYLAIHNCVIDGGTYGIHIRGSGISSYSEGNSIVDNKFQNTYYMMFYFYYVGNTDVKFNDMRGWSSNAYKYSPMYWYYGNNNNVIGNFMVGGYFGCLFAYQNRYVSGTSKFYNNIITEIKYTGGKGYYGLYTYYNMYTKYYHNSIWADVQGYGWYGYYNENCEIKNNNIRISAPNYSFYLYGTWASNSIDYNNYYDIQGQIYFGTTLYSDVKSWFTGVTDQNKNSTENEPAWKSLQDLHGTTKMMPNIVTNYLIDFDIDKDTRSPPLVMQGADEYPIPPDDLDIISIDSPTTLGFGNNNIVITLANTGSNTISPQTIYLGYSKNNGNTWLNDSLVFTSNWAPFTTKQFTFSVPWNIVLGGTYNYCTRIFPQIPKDADTIDMECKEGCTALKGTFTVKTSGGDFSDIQDAVDQLIDCGVYGPVLIEVYPGTYPRVVVPEILGASAKNSIIIRGTDRDRVIISHAGGSAYQTPDQATFTFDGADYVTIENMTILNSATSWGQGILFTHNADYNKVSGCNVHLDNYNTGYLSVITSCGAYYYGTRGNNSYNIIENCNLDGGYFGICWYSSSTSGEYNTFRNNTLTRQYYYGIYLYFGGGNKIMYNTIKDPREYLFTAGAYYLYGIYTYQGPGDSIIGNIIQPGRVGIYCYYKQDPAKPTIIANNMISNFKNGYSNTYCQGIYVYFSKGAKIWNNNIWMNSAYTSTYFYDAALWIGYSDCDIKNNIILSSDNSVFINLYYNYNYNTVNIDYNDYYWLGGSGGRYYAYSTNIYYPDLNSFKSYTDPNMGYVTHDQNSFEQLDPQFISQTDMHLLKGVKGTKGELNDLQADVDGDQRCKLETYIGADEPFWSVIPVDFLAEDTMCFKTPLTFVNTGIEDDPHTTSWYLNTIFQTNDYNFLYSFDTVRYNTVSLIMGTCSGVDTATKVIFINTPLVAPIAEFMVDKNVVEIGEEVSFANLSLNCPIGWKWEITPSSMMDPVTGKLEPAIDWGTDSDTSQNPVVKFKYTGTYSVCNIASNQHGNSPKECKNDYIVVKFSANMCDVPNRTEMLYGNLYDDGGPDNDYTTNTTCDYLIKSCGKTVNITFEELYLATGTYLRLYDGINARGTPLWNQNVYGSKGITGNMANPFFDTTVTATISGMVYVQFESGTQNASGFKLEWGTTPGGSYGKPEAAFLTEDTSCIVYPVLYQNTSFANHNYTDYRWDYDGNGSIDANTIDGEFITSFPGLAATYITTLIAENCGGMDTFSKVIVLTNPTLIKDGKISADIQNPVINTNIVTLTGSAPRLYCVNKWEWEITPNKYYFRNKTNNYSEHPQLVFTDTICYEVKVILGNTNTSAIDTVIESCFIKPIRICNPQVLSSSSDIGISHVKIASIDMTSLVGENDGYSDYSNSTITDLIMDQDYEILVERKTNFNSMTRKVWIDYNKDGNFYAANELVAEEKSAMTLSWTGTFKVPINIQEGGTTMRVSAAFGTYPNLPCGPVLVGEVEDYRVKISPDNSAPVITILGNNPDTLEKGFPYTDPGATAVDNIMGNVPVTVENRLNSGKIGIHFIDYTACDTIPNCATVTRIIIVVEDASPPVITLHGGNPAYVALNVPYQDPGYDAWDWGDGNLTPMVIVTHNVNTSVVGTYYVTYTVSDSKGYTDTKTRTIKVADVAAPDIELLGDSIVYHEIMTSYNDAGVVYSDNYWPYDKIVFQKSGLVDTTRIGEYILTYSVTDASGNGPNTVERRVIVYDSVAPVITGKHGDVLVVEVYEQFVDPGLDIEDNSISGFTVYKEGSFYDAFSDGIPTKLGNFIIFYYITDAAGNESNRLGRIVKVVDSQAPELSLKGNPYVMLERWDDTYVDEGYTITDNYADVSELTVDTTSNLDILLEGYYSICYTAEDPEGNETSPVCRLISVVNDNSIEDASAGTSVSIYPNPSTGKFVINVDISSARDVRISILNVLGEEISEIVDGTITSRNFMVDLSEMADGIYMVKVQTDANTSLQRIMISK